MVDESILSALGNNEKKLLLALKDLKGVAKPVDILKSGAFKQEVEFMGAASWLEMKGLAKIDEKTSKIFLIGDKSFIENQLPERKAIIAIDKNGGKMTMVELANALPNNEDKIAVGWLKRKGLADIIKDGEEKVLVLTELGKKTLKTEMDDEIVLSKLAKGPIAEKDADLKIIKDLKGRQGAVVEDVLTERTISLTEDGKEVLKIGFELKDEIVEVTDTVIQSGQWKNADFRRYDIQTFAPAIYPAKKHPLTRLASEIRKIFTDMGFTEFDGEYVQAAFWNLDVLFIPQDHPARELQDTFYLEYPKTEKVKDDKLVEAVKNIHENGGDTGSTGWGGTWSREMAEQALLRTHTTVNSIKSIMNNPNPPSKMFSLSRIFRKESIDATHLPEFTQIEGIIIDENGNFDMLVSLIREFYSRMGFDQIRIRPAYFPYTEPSLELEVFFNNKWMELGGAGIFRPEVVAPFGVKYPVLAWGFGFERLAMLKWGITDIRDLYISDIEDLKNNTIL